LIFICLYGGGECLVLDKSQHSLWASKRYANVREIKNQKGIIDELERNQTDERIYAKKAGGGFKKERGGVPSLQT
jgi:hypothetical protein